MALVALLQQQSPEACVVNLSDVRPYQDKTAILKLKDGEITTAKTLFVDPEYDDMIVDMVSTNRPENYRNRESAYVIPVDELISIEEISN